MSPAHFAFGFAAASLELPLPVLDEGLDEVLGEAVVPEDELSLGELAPELVLSELVLPLGDDVAPELMLPALGGAPASLEPALPPDAPEELSPDELPLLLAPALVPALPPAAPPAPCAQAAVANASMDAVTAALMSFRFIFDSSRVGRGDLLRRRGTQEQCLRRSAQALRQVVREVAADFFTGVRF